MKKLMCALAAVAAGVAVADVTSANIVGYVTSPASSAYQAQGSAFVPVMGGKISIQDIVPVPPEGGELTEWSYYINDVDVGGSTSTQYVYMPEGTGDCSTPGWYMDGEGELSTRSYNPGEGFFFTGEDGCSVTSSGEVYLDEIVLDASSAYSLHCNPRPVQISIQGIIPIPPEGGELSEWTYYINDMDVGGSTSTQYVYMPEGTDVCSTPGWYRDGEGDLSNRTYEPGEGFYYTGEDDCKIKFPKMTLPVAD